MASLLVSLVRRIARALVPDVVIHGRNGKLWNGAVSGRARVWKVLRKAGAARHAKGEPHWWRKRVVVPLLEKHIASMPEGCHALVPGAEALALLADKLKFARHASEQGVAHLLPQSIDPRTPEFPAVLKRTNLNSGVGVAVVASQRELDEKLALAPWAGEPVVLQEFVPSNTDYVTHVVCVRGRIVWHRSYSYPLTSQTEIRGPVETLTIERHCARLSDVAAFEKLLLPLGFNGPANVDYRRRPDGSLAIFEINPRLGGSLMRPEHVADLADCLRTIVRHARWRPRQVAVAAPSGEEARA
jgi:hypothetical protein